MTTVLTCCCEGIRPRFTTSRAPPGLGMIKYEYEIKYLRMAKLKRQSQPDVSSHMHSTVLVLVLVCGSSSTVVM